VFSIIRHQPTCPLLCQRIRERWAPRKPERLPETPPLTAFPQRAKYARRHKVLAGG
jgi:hypothetical protein